MEEIAVFIQREREALAPRTAAAPAVRFDPRAPVLDGPESAAWTYLVLDIGEDGALVQYTGPELIGREIEVSRKGQQHSRTHTAVHERRVRGAVVFAGVFPELPEGEYQIWTDEPRPVTEFTIAGGHVCEVDWRP